MADPPPSKTYVLLDERDDSINDAYYVMMMDGYPNRPPQRTIVDYPSSYHNGAGAFSFVDGHAEIPRRIRCGSSTWKASTLFLPGRYV